MKERDLQMFRFENHLVRHSEVLTLEPGNVIVRIYLNWWVEGGAAGYSLRN